MHSFAKPRCALVLAVATLTLGAAGAAAAHADGGIPAGTVHSERSYAPETPYTSQWTRADFAQIATLASGGQSAKAESVPDLGAAKQAVTDSKRSVWSPSPLAASDDDGRMQQFSYKGWDVLIANTATNDDAHRDVHSRLALYFRKANTPASKRPANGGWKYGGTVFHDDAQESLFAGVDHTAIAETTGDFRLDSGNRVEVHYTATARSLDDSGAETSPASSVIASASARIKADANGVWLTSVTAPKADVAPDGAMYTDQAGAGFRDPFMFTDPEHPGETYLMFAAHTGSGSSPATCNATDLGYRVGDPAAETVDQVNQVGAGSSTAAIGLAVRDDGSDTWRLLPPVLSGTCVASNFAHPSMVINGDDYRVYATVRANDAAAGLTGVTGLYGFEGSGLRSDFAPLNGGSGLVVADTARATDERVSDFTVMPGNLVALSVESPATTDAARVASLGPDVRLDDKDGSTTIDTSFGDSGLGSWGDIPSTRNSRASSGYDKR